MGNDQDKRRVRQRWISGLILSLSIVAILLAACGGSPSKSTNGAGTSVQRVNITLSEFKITSSQTSFQAGRAYQFVVTNKGTAEHEFMTMPASMGATRMGAMSMEDMHKIALFHIDAEDLPAGATKTVMYTFRNAAPMGQLEFTCYVPGHYEAGMHTGISVMPGS